MSDITNQEKEIPRRSFLKIASASAIGLGVGSVGYAVLENYLKDKEEKESDETFVRRAESMFGGLMGNRTSESRRWDELNDMDREDAHAYVNEVLVKMNETENPVLRQSIQELANLYNGGSLDIKIVEDEKGDSNPVNITILGLYKERTEEGVKDVIYLSQEALKKADSFSVAMDFMYAERLIIFSRADGKNDSESEVSPPDIERAYRIEGSVLEEVARAYVMQTAILGKLPLKGSVYDKIAKTYEMMGGGQSEEWLNFVKAIQK